MIFRVHFFFVNHSFIYFTYCGVRQFGHGWMVWLRVKGLVTCECSFADERFFTGERFSHGWTVCHQKIFWSHVNYFVMSKRFGHNWTVRSCVNDLVTDDWTVWPLVNILVMGEQFGHKWMVWSWVNGFVRNERFDHGSKVLYYNLTCPSIHG